MWMRAPLLCVALAACTTKPPPTAEQQLKWLEGGWRDVADETTTIEQWSVQPDGSLLGSGRVLVGELIGFAETLAIVSTPKGLVYTAWPAGQNPVRFSQGRIAEYSVTFENPSHDFPRTITYTRVDATHLEVEAIGVTQGEPREESWKLERFP